jgi:5-methylcytosine-specific restriction endonuclease McrA
MARQRNTAVTGRAFDEKIIDAVWNKAQTIEDKDPAEYRSDIIGNIIYRGSYGKETIMGWEIDHIKPVSKGGTDDLDNLQALNSAANAKKGNIYPWP